MDDISIENYTDFIEKFKINHKECLKEFNNISKDIDETDFDQKLIIDRVMSSLHTDFLKEVEELQVKGSKEDWLDLTNYRGPLLNIAELRETFEVTTKALQEQVAMTTPTNNKLCDIVNPHLIHSRQTKNPFIVQIMNPGARYKCNGCQETIHLQDIYLKHMEEYPAGTKILRPHSYHIKKECLYTRGFQEFYLSTIKVICDIKVDETILENIENIGFLPKNIRKFDDSDCESDSISDSISHTSETCQYVKSSVVFVYRRKHNNQKKVIICTGCKGEILSESFLTFGNTFDKIYHINKRCLKSEDLISVDFSSVKCRVFRMLRDHNEVKQLMACGFFFKNIIGNKPPNPNLKNKPIPPPFRSSKPIKLLPKDVSFLFNNESFTCEKLIHNERCSGCSDHVRKEEMVLRHKEKVPRDKLTESPLISQFYHTSRNCLIDRGFTDKYIELSECNVTLSGSDNLQKIRDSIIRCGFSSNKINFIITEDKLPQEVKPNVGFCVEKTSKESCLFIVNCIRAGGLCEGCGFNIAPNTACFVYGLNSIQDLKAKLFHINEKCLKCHFTKSQILSMSCINNNSMVDVDPRDVIKCGIVNIKTGLQLNQSMNAGSKYNPFKSILPRFVVDTTENINEICPGCKDPVSIDKYALKVTHANDKSATVYIHISPPCLNKCGHFPQQLSKCDLSFEVGTSSLLLQRLTECGFTKIPKNSFRR